MYKDLVLKYKEGETSSGNIFTSTNDLFLSKYFKNDSPDISFIPPFIPGEIYSFRYLTDSEISKKRPFIDRMPLVICTDVFNTLESGTVIKGIDLITVPNIIRVDIIERIYDNFYEQLLANKNSYEKGSAKFPVNLKDPVLKNILKGTGYLNSYFGFKYKFIKNVKIISMEDWPKIPYLSFNMIEGLSIQGIYNEYRSKLI